MIHVKNNPTPNCAEHDAQADTRPVDRRIMPDELSDVADATEPASPSIRRDLVARVKRQIKLGIYDEEAKIDAILDRLMADLVKDETK